MNGNNLQRKLGLFPATNIVVANMIGAGIFTTSGLLMSGLNNPVLMLILWIAGGVIALCGALPSVPAWFSTAFNVSQSSTGKILSISVILLFTFIHYFGLKSGTFIQNFLTILKVALILFLLIAGFSSGKGDIANFTGITTLATGMDLWKSIGLSLMWIMFAYSGWNASTYLGAEIRNPSRTLPLSLILGTGIVIILYLALNTLYIYGIEPDEMKGVISVGGLAMGNLFGKTAEFLSSLLISFALFSSLSAFIIIGPRVYYSMAKDGLFFRSVSRIHPRFGVPSNSIVLQGIIAVILALSGTFEQILTYMGFALGIFPILTVTSVFLLRRKYPDAMRMGGFPVTQIIYATTGILILGLAFLERPMESSIAILTVMAGIPAYYIFSKNKN